MHYKNRFKELTSRHFTENSPFYFLIGILAIVFIIYWPNLSGPFLLDDITNIQPLITDNYTIDSIWHSISQQGIGPQGRPVSKLSLVSTLAFHGNSSWAFKYHNLLIHLLIALLLFWLFGRLLQYQFDNSKAWQISALASIFWAIMPLHVSTVLYPVQRMAQLSALFTVTGLLFLSFAWQAYITQHYKKTIFFCFIAFPGTLLLATLSKENGVLLLFYTLLLGFIVPIKDNIKLNNQRIFYAFLIFITAPIILGSLYLITHWNQFINYSGRSFSLADRLLSQANIVIYYLKMICLPRLKDMTLFHDDFPITRSLDAKTFLSILTLAILISSAWLVRKRYPIIAFGVFWFFTGHLLESTIIPLEMIFEHRNYLASFGIMLILAFLIIQLPVTKPLRYIISSSIIIIFLAMTVIRSHAWSNDELLHRINLQDHPGSARTQINYANILLEKNLLNEARQYLKTAIAIKPFEAGTVLHLYTTYCYAEKMPEQLIEKSLKILSNHPISAYGLSAINILNQRKNNQQCPALSSKTLISLIDTAINNKKSESSLEHLYRLKAQAFVINGKFNQAVKFFKKSYLTNHNAEILIELLDFQIGSGFFSDAHQTLKKLREIDKSLHKDRYKLDFLEKRLKSLEDKASVNQAGLSHKLINPPK